VVRPTEGHFAAMTTGESMSVVCSLITHIHFTWRSCNLLHSKKNKQRQPREPYAKMIQPTMCRTGKKEGRIGQTATHVL
ncbi:hypothetical protein BT96DRAFT_929144, partial [Gymnopus androsaceus JB14]